MRRRLEVARVNLAANGLADQIEVRLPGLARLPLGRSIWAVNIGASPSSASSPTWPAPGARAAPSSPAS